MLPSSLPEKILLPGTCTVYGTLPGQGWQKAVLSLCTFLSKTRGARRSRCLLAPFLAPPSRHMVMYGDDTHWCLSTSLLTAPMLVPLTEEKKQSPASTHLALQPYSVCELIRMLWAYLATTEAGCVHGLPSHITGATG